jgi:hypothetical protein
VRTVQMRVSRDIGIVPVEAYETPKGRAGL